MFNCESRVKCRVREQSFLFACLTPVIYFGLRSELVNVVYKTIRDRDIVQKITITEIMFVFIFLLDQTKAAPTINK